MSSDMSGVAIICLHPRPDRYFELRVFSNSETYLGFFPATVQSPVHPE